MQLIKGIIAALSRDSRGVLHIHFHRGWRAYEFWAVDNEAVLLEEHDRLHGAIMDISARPIIIRINEVTDEVLEVIKIEE